MKIKMLVLVMLLTVSGVFAQKNVLGILNGDFELGTVQLWRAIEVRAGAFWYLGVDDAQSTVKISDDAHSGNYAAAFTWEIDPAMGDLVFDLGPMITAETDYTFKAWAKSLDGPCILRMHCTYFSGNITVLGDHMDQSWILSDEYEEHVWEVPPAPEGVLFAQIGFRVFNANGSRWPATAITTLIDDVTMWRESHESDGIDYKLARSFMGPGTGTIEFVPAGGIYCEGTQVTATVKHDACSQFVSWSGDASGTDQTVTVLMDGDKTIVAEMTTGSGMEYELTTGFTGTGTGSIEFDPAGGIYCEGKQVSATLIPDEGSQFVGWSGDASGTDQTVTVLMDGDKTIVAEIEIIEGVEEVVSETSTLKSYPNPFSSSTTLSYTLSENADITLSVYSITGSLVNVLVNQHQAGGEYAVNWNASNFDDGVYLARLNISNGKSQYIKIFLNK